MKSLDIICPVYNEAEVIMDFYRELRSELDKLSHYNSRTIFVLDKCSDNTESILQALCRDDKRVTLISLSSRFGHQMSLVAGMDNSDADYTVMMDCDLEHPPKLIQELLKKAEDGYDVVYTVRKYAVEAGFFKRFTSNLYYKFINAMTDLDLESGTADFRLVSAKVRDVFKKSLREQNQFLRGLISWLGFNSVAVHYQSQTRRAGVSKYHLRRLIQFASIGIISFSKKPLRLAIYFGFLTSIVVLGIFIYHLYAWIRFSNLPPGWTTLALLISLIGSAQLFFLGIIGEYLGFIFDEVKARPLYVIERKIN